MKTAVSVFLATFVTAAFAAPPAPTISVAATDIKQLQFDITPVAQVNRYELWFKANAGATWVKYTESPAQRPLIRIGISAHLLDWPQARYHVKACNPSGCSTSNEVGVNAEKLASLGFFKPEVATGAQSFGGHVAASADGRTIAVVSAETIQGQAGTGVIHVYRKTTSTSGWRREKRLVPVTGPTDPQHAQLYLGDQVTISGDGNLIVYGAWDHQLPGAPYGTGSVYVFQRLPDGWAQVQVIDGDRTGYGDYFGFVVKLDDAGKTLAITHQNPGGNVAGGTLEIYTWATDHFTHSKTLPTPPNTDGSAGECNAVGLSGDGKTLMRACYGIDHDYNGNFVQVFKAPDWTLAGTTLPGGTIDGIETTYDASQVLVQDGSYGIAYRRAADGTYVYETFLTSFDGIADTSRRQIALSRDGKIAAIGNYIDTTLGLGPIFPPYQTDRNREVGGVVVHERKSNGTWSIRRAIKPGSTNEQAFGHVVALGDNGKLLVVGAPTDASAATGIDGDRDDSSAPNRGAVWIY